MHISLRAAFLSVLAGSTLAAQVDTTVGRAPYRLADLTGDGLPDKLRLAPDGSLSVLVNRGHGIFDEIRQELPRVIVEDVLLSDLDGDGHTDVYLVSGGPNVALLGNGQGLLQEATDALGLADAGVGRDAERLDVDGDGLADLVLHNTRTDIAFFARAGGTFVRDTDGPRPAADVPTADMLPTFMAWLIDAATNPSSLGGNIVVSMAAGDDGQPVVSLHIPTDAEAVQGVTTSAPSLSPSQAGMSAADSVEAEGSGTAALGGPTLGTDLNTLYVNDGAGEVDSADIADGSLTGADISTSGGNISFGPGTLTMPGKLIAGILEAPQIKPTFGIQFGDGSFQSTATLQGPPGQDGADGAQGPPGQDGADGAAGAQGPMGLSAAHFSDDGVDGWGVDPVDAIQDLIAIPVTPRNATLRSLTVYGEDPSVTYDVYSVAVETGTPTLLGSGTVGTLLDISDFITTNYDNYMLLRFDASATSQTIYGGKMFGEDTGTPTAGVIRPQDFIVNNDG
ncbi:MAG: FG-GAP repeat domain-containing protein [Planctomycetota bacterium]|jgi:hypothetical protein